MSNKIPRIYIEACPLIDMAQDKADGLKGNKVSAGVWFCQQALRAGRDKKAKILTSFLSIAECTRINIDADTQPTAPPEEIKHFYEMLLLSGKSGLELIPITQTIAIKARNLRWISEINLKGADTIHVASAMQLQCDEIWTRDGRIWKHKEKLSKLGISVVRPSESQFLPGDYQAVPLFEEE
jgi:PIN domain nuclease of toxin-antitoxin system